MEPQNVEMEFDVKRFINEMTDKMRDDVLAVIGRNFATIRSVTPITPRMRIRLMQATCVAALQLLSMEYTTAEAAATIAILALAIDRKNAGLPPPAGDEIGDVGVEMMEALTAILQKATKPCLN